MSFCEENIFEDYEQTATNYCYDDEFYTPNKNIDTEENMSVGEQSFSSIEKEKNVEQIYPLRKAVSCTTCELCDSNSKVTRNEDGGFALRKVVSCSICTWDVDAFAEEDFKGSVSDDDFGQAYRNSISSDNDEKNLESPEEKRPRIQRSNSYTKAMDENNLSDVENDKNVDVSPSHDIKIQISSTDDISSAELLRSPPDGGESFTELESPNKREHEKLMSTPSSSEKSKNNSLFKSYSFKKRKPIKQNSLDRKATEELDDIFGKLKKTPENSFDEHEEGDLFHLNISNEKFVSPSSKKPKTILKRLLPPKSLFSAKYDSKLRNQRSKSVEFLYTNEPPKEGGLNVTKSFSTMELAFCGLTDEDESLVDNLNERWISYLKKIGGMSIFGGNESLRYVWQQINLFQKDILQNFEDFLKNIIEEFQQAYMKCQELEGIIALKTEQQERETSKIYDDVERAIQEERLNFQEKQTEREEQIRLEYVKMLETKEMEIQDIQKQNQLQNSKIVKQEEEIMGFKQANDITDLRLSNFADSEQRLKQHINDMEEELLLMRDRLKDELVLRKELQDNLDIMTNEAKIEKENYKQCLRRCQDLLEEKEFLDLSISNLSIEVEELKKEQQLKYTPATKTPNSFHVNQQDSFDENYNHSVLSAKRSNSPISVASSISYPDEYQMTTPVIQTSSELTSSRSRLSTSEQRKYLLTSTAKKQLQYKNASHTPIRLASSRQTDFKVIFTGDMNVGKTSLIQRITEGRFRVRRETTLESDCSEKILEYNGQKVLLKLWDTVGQERFNSIPASYFRKSDVVLLMYDIANKASFLNTKTWIKTVHENTNESIFLVLVGNKTDLHHKREVTINKGKLLAKEYDAMFIESSAKSGENVNELCDMIASTLLEREDTLLIRNNFEESFVCSLTNSQRRNTQNICCS